MAESQTIWTFLSTYSFIQGLLLAVYAIFVMRRPFLSAILCFISLLIAAHLYYHFKWFFAYPDFIFAEAPLWYLIGPLFYFFTLNFFGRTLKWIQLLHLLPFLIFLVYMFPFYTLSGAEKLEILGSIFGKEGYRQDMNRLIFSAHIFIYILISYLAFNRYSRKLKESSASSGLILDASISLILRYYLLFSFMGFSIYLVIGSNYEWSDVFYTAYYLGLSFLIHIVFYFSVLRVDNEVGTLEEGETKSENQKYASSSLSEEKLDEINKTLLEYVSDFGIYRNPELRLRMVAEALDIPLHHLSQAINQQMGISFFDLINQKRIEGIKQNINDPKYRNYTLAGIASEHGFNSSSSFYRIFKKYTGQTPKQYFKGKG